MTTDPYLVVAQRVFPGATLAARAPLTGGVSAGVDALVLRLPDGARRAVVVRGRSAGWKGKPHDAVATQYALQRALHDAGLPVPLPLLVDVSCTVLPTPFLVMERVDGTTDVAAPDVVDAARAMADFLAALHALSPDALALPALPAGDDPIADALACAPHDAVDVRAALARATLAPVAPALLHGDYWPGNVLWRDGRVAAVVDWEDAAIGDPASDAACCRVELQVAYGDDAVDAFTARWRAHAGARAANLPVWDVYVAAAALASMGDWGLPRDVEARRRAATAAFFARAAAALAST